jgi:tetratricopeptide (TPR) repeat protein
MEPGGYSFRRMERERLAKERARKLRSRILRRLMKAGLFVALTAVVAWVTYAFLLDPDFPVRNLVGTPRRLISASILVNGVPTTVPLGGSLSLNPADVVKVQHLRTEKRFAWGLSLRSEQFPAERLLEARRTIGDFWPDHDYAEPLKVSVEVMGGANPIGRFYFELRLGDHDWVKRAQAASTIGTKIEYLERAARLGPENALILIDLGKLYGENGEWPKAAATYEKVAASSRTREVVEKLVEAQEKAGNVDKALDAYLKLMDVSGSDKEPFNRFVSYLASKKGPDGAAAYLADKVTSLPASLQPDAHAYLGTLLGEQGRWKEAIEAYRRALAGGVTDPLIDLNLGEAYSRVGDYESAEESLLAYVKKKPQDEDGKLRLAEIYRERKKYAEAIQLLKDMSETNRQDLKVLLALASVYDKAKMTKEAAAAYEEITALAPENGAAQYNKGVFYFEMKQYDRAAKGFSEAARIDSKDIEAREYLLRIYQEKKNPREALGVLQQLIGLRPTHWDYYGRAFALYDQLKSYKEMTRTFAAAVERAPERDDLRSFLGVAYEKRGLLSEAIRQFEAAARLSPKNKAYLNHVASLYERKGKPDAALKAYKKVLEIDPNDPKAQENYLRLKVMRLEAPRER